MARLQHSVVVVPVARAWFEQAVAVGWDALDERLGAATGFSSDDGTFRATVDEWHRHADSAGRVTIVEDGATTTCHLRLRSAAAPRTLDLEGGAGDGRWMTTFTLRLHADLERWWTAAAQSGTRPVIEGRLRHALGLARVAVTPAPEPGGRWRLDVTVTVRGRHVFRPLAAVVLFFARKPVRRKFADGLDRFAGQWNDEMPELLEKTPQQLSELIADELR
jgi:hypothetical protein